MRTSPTKLRVIDPIAQHDVKVNGQLARHGDLGRSRAFAKRQATVDAPQSGIKAAGGLRRLDQEKAQQAIALFGQVTEALPSAAGRFLRNQPHVAGDVLGVGKTFHRSED